MKVYKFGGASVRSAEGIRNIVSIVSHVNEPLFMVVSAMGKTTNAMEEVLWSLHELWRRNSIRRYTGEICAGQAIGVI